MSLDDIEWLDNNADIGLRILLDKELSRRAEITRQQNKLDMAEAVRAGSSDKKGYDRWEKDVRRGIGKLKGIKVGRDITGLLKAGRKF